MPSPTASRFELKTPLARAVVPVLGGVLLLLAIGVMLWGIAAYMSRDGSQPSERLAPTRFEVSSVETAANTVEEDGPILFPGLDTTTGERTIVLDHEGTDATVGWTVYYAYPAGEDPSCVVEQVRGTRKFIDCNGDTIDVTALAPPPPGINPVVEGRRTLYIDLRGAEPN